jgi:hypothetical protein
MLEGPEHRLTLLTLLLRYFCSAACCGSLFCPCNHSYLISEEESCEDSVSTVSSVSSGEHQRIVQDGPEKLAWSIVVVTHHAIFVSARCEQTISPPLRTFRAYLASIPS